MTPEEERAFYERFYAPLRDADPAGYQRLLFQKLVEVGLEQPVATPKQLSERPVINNTIKTQWL